MTDLEMVKACAEAMGHEVKEHAGRLSYVGGEPGSFSKLYYDPLHDDAQAMALVKKLGLSVSGPTARDKDRKYYVWCAYQATMDTDLGQSTDLNRAIVSCVAKLKSL